MVSLLGFYNFVIKTEQVIFDDQKVEHIPLGSALAHLDRSGVLDLGTEKKPLKEIVIQVFYL